MEISCLCPPASEHLCVCSVLEVVRLLAVLILYHEDSVL